MPEVNMPRLSDTMQEGTIARWLKQPGDEVKKGDVLAEIETDKANMELEAYESGTLQQILSEAGQTVPIGQVIAIIGSGKAQAAPAVAISASSTQKQDQKSARSQSAPAKQVPSASLAEAVSTQTDGNGRDGLKASPLARRMAEEHGIDLSKIHGTGPGGRIVRDDIEDFLEQRPATTQPHLQQPAAHAQVVTPAQPAVAENAPAKPVEQAEGDEVIALSRMQTTIARRLTESKQQVPHFYVSNDIDMTDLLALRQTLNANVSEGGVKVSVNDLIIKACALALEKHPQVNGSYREGQFVLHNRVNVGMAVDIPSGLVVPVIHDANIKGVRSIARESKALVEKARVGKVTVADLEGGSFSVSNLGMMDVSQFIAVINPPESAILAVSATRKTFVPVNDQPVLRDIMRVTLSADHRILYGATVARFLQEVKQLLQNPYQLLG